MRRKFAHEVLGDVCIDILRNIRKERGFVRFVQIGAYDGISFDDLANISLFPEDRGIFIEPVPEYFKRLCDNKAHFENALFLNKAVVPTSEFFSEHFYIDRLGGQSTYMWGIVHQDTLENSNWEYYKPVTLTVSELLEIQKEEPDIYFIDAEGYDRNIISELLKHAKPSILYFESSNTTDSLNTLYPSTYFITHEELYNNLLEKGYQVLFDRRSENVLAWLA
jgi:hypothetical protein